MNTQPSVGGLSEESDRSRRSSTAGVPSYLDSFRETRALPYELREHCIIYFEEAMYTQALNLLTSLLTAGGASSSPSPAYLPPPQHLALIATLLVHPSFTTRAKEPERAEAANLALRYLRLVFRTVGPIHANFHDAFAFAGGGALSRRGTAVRKRAGDNSADSPEAATGAANSIDIPLANANSLWTRADDFWHVVGWAFNCSLLHPHRWAIWELWLELMIGILEVDWDVRGEAEREDSLVVKYIDHVSGHSSAAKRVVRAIFADGSPRSLAEFAEIWKNEPKLRKEPDANKEAAAAKAPPTINIDEGEFGDYFLQSSSAEEEEDNGEGDDEEDNHKDKDKDKDKDVDVDTEMDDQQSKSLTKRSRSLSPPPLDYSNNGAARPDGFAILGGQPATVLRLRLLSLLSGASYAFPHRFIPLATLFDLYLTHMRPFPLPTFALLLAPPSLSYFTPAAASSLAQYILRSLLSSSAPLPRSDSLSQDVWERCFAPWPANTMAVEDNAKVSLCVEVLLRILDGAVGVVWSEELVEAAEKGIRAREEKARKEGRRKGEASGGGGVAVGKSWLRASAERIRGVVEIAKA